MSNPAEKEQPKDEENNESKLLSKKRKQKFTLEDIINVYCCRHKIADNEIQEKIKTIYYEKPDEIKDDKIDKMSDNDEIKKKIDLNEIIFKEDEKEKDKEKERKKS